MVDREQDPNSEAERRERERELHRAQLDAVRSAFQAEGRAAPPDAEDSDDAYRTEYLVARLSGEMRRLDRRQRNLGRVAAALAVSVVVGALAYGYAVLARIDGSYVQDEISARSIRADHVAVTGNLRVLDAAGNELAVLGHELGAGGESNFGGPVVLALNAEGDPSRQLLRFAASKKGAGLTIESPAGSSSVSLLSTQSGSTVEVRNGDQTQSLSGERALPPVGAGARAPAMIPSRAGEVPAWSAPRSDAPRGDIPELRAVGHGFLVADLSVRPATGGVEVLGRMVNTTAVVHNALAFRIVLGDASATWTVPKISPGNSTGFRVALPGLATARMEDAKIEYLGSTIAYQATSTEPIYGRHLEPN